ncbi:MAG: branched-chain amino acid ABC transporter permease [Thermodesulfobacteriota bacterium]|nr:branched-chain amino acid ABC transporter permease [Thermodesulfobacteriota bacterium]
MAIRSKTFRETYQEDIGLFQTIWVKCWWVVLIIILLIFPFWADPYLIYMFNFTMIFVIAGMGLNILTGAAGQISLCQGAFVGIGSYTIAIMASKLNMPFWVTLPMAGIIPAVMAILIGVISLRVKGLYLAMATMAFGAFVQYLFFHWNSLTNGTMGIVVMPVTIGDFSFDTNESRYFPFLIIAALLLLGAKNILRTRIGRAFVAIRDRDISAECMGVDLTKYKVMAFSLSAFYAGIAGWLYANLAMHVNPEYFTLVLSIEYIMVAIVGGLGTVLGTVLGAIFVVIIPEIIKGSLTVMSEIFPSLHGIYNEEWNIAAFGLMIMLFLIFEPGGMCEIYMRIKRAFKSWPFSY